MWQLGMGRKCCLSKRQQFYKKTSWMSVRKKPGKLYSFVSHFFICESWQQYLRNNRFNSCRNLFSKVDIPILSRSNRLNSWRNFFSKVDIPILARSNRRDSCRNLWGGLGFTHKNSTRFEAFTAVEKLALKAKKMTRKKVP